MFSALSHLAALISSGIPPLRLLALALAIAAFPIQPLGRVGSSSILTKLSSLLTPVGHQYQERCAGQWPMRAELGKDYHGAELTPSPSGRKRFEPVMLAMRVLAGVGPAPQLLLAADLSGRAPPSS
jgi:hypothetical protein